MRKDNRSLKAAVEGMASAAKTLRELERRAHGVEKQYAAIPHRHEGPQTLLDNLQRRIDREFERTVGKRFRPDDFAAPETVRGVLHDIERLADLTGAKVEIGALPSEPQVWTDDPELYAPLDRDDPERKLPGSRFQLAERIRLNPDGSRRR